MTSRREETRSEPPGRVGALSKGEGLTGEFHKGGRVYTEHWMLCVNPRETPETGTPHNVYTLIYTFRYKGKKEDTITTL